MIKLTEARYQGEFQMALRFSDGKEGIFDGHELLKRGGPLRDFGYPDADALQLRDFLAAEILKTLDREKLTVRQAHARTGIAAADFSRIRKCDLKRFTLDRLMGIVNKLGSRVEMILKFKAEAEYAAGARATALLAALSKAVPYKAGKGQKVKP